MDYKASVKTMRSYDYCHFEVCLGSDEDLTKEQVDDMRKEAMRLVDKAVSQYQTAKKLRSWKTNNSYTYQELCHRASLIRKEVPDSDRTPEQQAVIKECEDMTYRMNRFYDYEDDYEDDWEDRDPVNF